MLLSVSTINSMWICYSVVSLQSKCVWYISKMRPTMKLKVQTWTIRGCRAVSGLAERSCPRVVKERHCEHTNLLGNLHLWGVTRRSRFFWERLGHIAIISFLSSASIWCLSTPPIYTATGTRTHIYANIFPQTHTHTQFLLRFEQCGIQSYIEVLHTNYIFYKSSYTVGSQSPLDAICTSNYILIKMHSCKHYR